MLRRLFSSKRNHNLKIINGNRNFKTRTSYSIEAEDLLLGTIFSRVLGKHTPGTYIDLGAAHPIEHSNTYLFYENGWRGICVEPNPDFISLYNQYRPEDKIINVGLAPTSSTLTYHRFTEPLINGFFGQEIIDGHLSRGDKYLGNVQIQCIGIKEFLANEVAKKEIDLLNIDVETLDAVILGSWDWSICRPKVIAAEIHSSSMDDMLQRDVAVILRNSGYSAMSRGFMTTIFVDSSLLPNV